MVLNTYEPRKRFLVIGESGVGKTHTVNVLCGTQHNVSDSAIGTTFSFQSGNRRVHTFVDTIGLSEGDAGKIHPAVAFAKLVAFVKGNEEGFNGIFLIVDRPKVTKSMQENYRLFVEQVTRKKVPCFLFVNKQELEDGYKDQYERNKHLYVRSGFDFEYGFAGGCKTNDMKVYTLGQFDSCISMAPDESEKIYENTNFWYFVTDLWNQICKLFATVFGTDFEEPEDNSIAGIFKQMGVPDHLAREVAKKTAMTGLTDDIIDELAQKLRDLKKSHS